MEGRGEGQLPPSPLPSLGMPLVQTQVITDYKAIHLSLPNFATLLTLKILKLNCFCQPVSFAVECEGINFLKVNDTCCKDKSVCRRIGDKVAMVIDNY